MATIIAEQGKCEIYPDTQEQFCMRVRLRVVQLKPGPSETGDWVPDGTELRSVDLRCSDRGLKRLLDKVDAGTKPPTPRTRKPKVEPGVAS